MPGQLFVRIDRSTQLAVFSGPGTYDARQLIKESGRARFVRDGNEWHVLSFTLSRDEVELRFPGVIVDEIAAAVVAGERASLPPSAVSLAMPSPTPAFFPGIEPVIPETPTAERTDAPSGLSVPQFLGAVRNAVKAAFPGSFCIYGVIRQANRSGADRMFIDLGAGPGEDEYVRCSIWAGASRICKPLEDRGFTLSEDLEVMFEVSVNIAGKGGYVSLAIKRIVVEYTIAKLAAQRDQTNDRLRKEGLFEQNRRLALPFLPRRLGILTSAGGTVIHDFQASLNEAAFGFELLWFPVTVQGSEAKASILKGLKVLSKVKNLDAILIFRGGGSQADLAVFNDYDIARAVCLAPVPVISAIGHQEDECSVQDVSFIGRGVPKDIGRFFADIVRDLRERYRRAVENVLHFGSLREQESSRSLKQFAQFIAGNTLKTVDHQALLLRQAAQALPRLGELTAAAGRRGFVRLIGPLQILAVRKHEMAADSLRHRTEHVSHRAAQWVATRTAAFAALGERTSYALSSRAQRAGFRLLEQQRLLRSAELLIERREVRVSSLEELLQSVGPEAQLKRGFLLARSGRGNGYLTSAALFDQEGEAQLEFYDGERRVVPAPSAPESESTLSKRR